MRHKLLVAFTLSGLISGVIAQAAPALATVTQNYPAFMCNSRDVQQNGGNAATVNGYGQAGNGGSSNLALFCPIVSDGSTIQEVTFSFWSNGYNVPNSFYAPDGSSVVGAGCSVNAGGGGGQCGGASGWTLGSGVYSLGVDAGAWNAGDYNFLQIVLSPVGNNSTSTFFGYQVTQSS